MTIGERIRPKTVTGRGVHLTGGVKRAMGEKREICVPVRKGDDSRDGIARANASPACKHCTGTGEATIYKHTNRICDCVYREITRKCIERYREIRASGSAGRCVVNQGAIDGFSCGLPNTEYVADVEICARRVLDAKQLAVFRDYCVGWAHWEDAARRAKLDRGLFFHCVYAIERLLGRELYASGMFPAGKYFRPEVPIQITWKGFTPSQDVNCIKNWDARPIVRLVDL